jgi:hypothetical protein
MAMTNGSGDGNGEDDGGRRRGHSNGGGGGVTHEAAGGEASREYGITIESEFTKRRWILIVDLCHLKFSYAYNCVGL